MNKKELLVAVEKALMGDWDASHNIAQQYNDVTANWLHAVLHKIEGDEINSQYWYARSEGKSYGDFLSTTKELKAIIDSFN